MAHKRRLGEVLLDLEYITGEVLEWAMANKPPGVRLGEFLVAAGKLTDEQRWEALSLQQGIEVFDIQPEHVELRIARSLPRSLMEELRVMPVRLEAGRLTLAAAAIPTDAMQKRILEYTKLRLEFSLVSDERFNALREHLL